MTGWRGLVNSRSRIEQRVANDLRYISEWSLLADLGIIWRTVFALAGKNVFLSLIPTWQSSRDGAAPRMSNCRSGNRESSAKCRHPGPQPEPS